MRSWPRAIGGGRLELALDVTLRIVAIALACSLVYAAVHDVSQAYDVWYYHLPFAARLGGVMDASTYAFSADNVARFQGYPLLAELLQGVIWRVTGHIEATNLVALLAVFGLVLFLWRLFAVPPHLALLALLAIPLVQIHATSSYVDLPSNACATMLLLCVYRLLLSTFRDGSKREPPSPRFLIGCIALAALAANMKFQLVPIVASASFVLVVLSLSDLRRVRIIDGAQRSRGALATTKIDARARAALGKRIAIIAIGLPIVFLTPLQNLVVHGNPVWPVEISAFGHSFPYVEAAYAQSPPHLKSSPRPVRFVRSALEIDNHPIAEHHRCSLDQWAPPNDPSSRMGGYFGAYVIVNLIALGWAAWRRRTREALAAATLFSGVTVIASLVPQSHELRYYMHWMMGLVSLNLILWTTSSENAARASPAHTHTRTLAGLVATSAFAVVVWSTSAGFLYASGSTSAQFVDQHVERSVIESLSPGERLCVARRPFTFLYAPAFHPSKSYAVQEALSLEADCKTSDRIIH